MRNFRFFFIIGPIILLIIFFLWAAKTPLAALYFSSKLKTPAAISKITFGSDHFAVNNLKIKNPKKTKSKYALIAQKIEVDFSFLKLFSAPRTIQKIFLENADLNIECRNPICANNNWTKIIANINEKQLKKQRKEIIINKLIIKNMSINIVNIGLGSNKITKSTVAYLEFNDIRGKKGFPAQEMIMAIFRSAGLDDYLKNASLTNYTIENAIDTFDELNEQSVQESFMSIEK